MELKGATTVAAETWSIAGTTGYENSALSAHFALFASSAALAIGISVLVPPIANFPGASTVEWSIDCLRSGASLRGIGCIAAVEVGLFCSAPFPFDSCSCCEEESAIIESAIHSAAEGPEALLAPATATFIVDADDLLPLDDLRLPEDRDFA